MKLLLLAGTTEARRLAARLARDSRFDAIASLAGATREPKPLPLPMRTGGFGGGKAQENWINDNAIDAIIDATHPFASRISHRTQAIAARAGVPYLQLLRPGFIEPRPGSWIRVADLDAAAAALAPGVTAFLATGRQSLAAFAHRSDVTLYLRQIDPPDGPFPLPRGGYVLGTPPFSTDDEVRLFRNLGVDALVVKDAGGPAVAKLAAAWELGLKVIMVDRPAQPPGEKAASVDDALAWLERHL